MRKRSSITAVDFVGDIRNGWGWVSRDTEVNLAKKTNRGGKGRMGGRQVRNMGGGGGEFLVG